MARPKPSSASLTVITPTVTFNKSQRKMLAAEIIDRYESFPIKEREVYAAEKLKLLNSGDSKTFPTEEEVLQILEKHKETHLKIPSLLSINGEDDSIYGKYCDEEDDKVCRDFFSQLESAATSYSADCLLDHTRPNKSEFIEGFRRIKDRSARLEKSLDQIDDGSRAYLASLNIDLDNAINLLHSLQDAYERSKEQPISKQNIARFNLCILTIKAFNSIGLTARSSRLGLYEGFIVKLIEEINGTTALDIQDSIRAALISLKCE